MSNTEQRRIVRCDLCGHLCRHKDSTVWIGYNVCPRCAWDTKTKWNRLPVNDKPLSEEDTCLFGAACFCNDRIRY